MKAMFTLNGSVSSHFNFHESRIVTDIKSAGRPPGRAWLDSQTAAGDSAAVHQEIH
jgi:hypothetical protein